MPLPPNPTLQDLAPLIGEWTVEAPQFGGPPGHVLAEWHEDGAYLRIHSVPPDPAPEATQLIGRDDAGDAYTVLYYDSRGVSRVYQMTFGDGVWRIWREAPGFHQRFTGTFSADGSVIEAAWEKSADGAAWEHDFDLIYTRRS